MKCPHCGQEHSDDTKFCPKTGKKLESQSFTCNNPECNYRQPLPLNAEFCPNCGCLLKKEYKNNCDHDGLLEHHKHQNKRRDRRYKSNTSFPDKQINAESTSLSNYIIIECADNASIYLREYQDGYRLHEVKLKKGTNQLSISKYPFLGNGFHFDLEAYNHQSRIISIDLEHYESSSIPDFWMMFHGCSSLHEINLNSLSSARPTNLGLMFSECSSIERVDLSMLNTRFVTTMWNMFDGCRNLKCINFKGFSTVNNKTFRAFFCNCESIEYLDVSDFDTSSVKDDDDPGIVFALGGGFQAMFSGCKSLKELDLSNFQTLGARVINQLFYDCSSLISINLSNWDLSNIISCKEMFNGCKSLKQIKAYGCNRTTLQLVRKALNEASLWGVKIDTDNIMFKIFG